MYFRTEPNRLPQSYDLSYTARQVGITLYEVRHVIVRDLVIQGFQLDGVNAHDGVRDTALVGLNCRGNVRSGISIGGASRVRLDSCLVGNNGAAQLAPKATRTRNSWAATCSTTPHRGLCGTAAR